MDNLATGFLHNISPFESNPKFEFLQADIRDLEACLAACEGMDLICHQAALGSVPRSIHDPITTHAVNITGTLHIFHAAVQKSISRIVFAASSSTYGDSPYLPKVEDQIGKPLSPYAVTKLVNELYADVFAKTYGLSYIGLRYFNIYGPNQDPSGAYAAVIPLFIKAALEGQSPTIHGNGSNSRDFTFVGNAVEANLKALFLDPAQHPAALNQIYNIACGEQATLTQLWEAICTATGTNMPAIYGPERKGDIPHSLADISKAQKLLSYEGHIKLREGLKKAVDWYREKKE